MTDDSWNNDSVRPSDNELTKERVVEHAPQPQDGDGRETEIPRGTPATMKEPVAFLLAEGMKVSAGPRPGTYAFGDCHGFSATKVLAFADHIRLGKDEAA